MLYLERRPPGAAFSIDQLKSPGPLFLVDALGPMCGLMTLRIIDLAVRRLDVSMHYLEGLEVWNRDHWEETTLLSENVHIFPGHTKSSNKRNDSFLFISREQAGNFLLSYLRSFSNEPAIKFREGINPRAAPLLTVDYGTKATKPDFTLSPAGKTMPKTLR